MKIYVSLMISALVFGILGVYFALMESYLYTLIAVFALTATSLTTAVISLILRKVNCGGNYQTYEKLNALYNKTNEMFNIFCMYFDSNFLLVNTVEKSKQKIDDTFLKYKMMTSSMKMTDDIVDKRRIKIINNENMKKIDSLINEIDEFIGMIVNLKDNIFVQMKAEITETYDRKDLFHKLVVEYQLYSEIIYDFVNSIRGNIEDTSKPLSEEIFIIRTNIYEFIKKIHAWRDDLTNDKTNKNFNNVIKKYDEQNTEFQEIFEMISKNYADLEIRFKEIIDVIEKVYKNSFQIQDISDKINLLSINASIEAAHSDKSGKGFKVIAEEIKKLSDNTKTIISNTVSLIGDSRNTIEKTIGEFSSSGQYITEKVNRQKKEFDIFYDILKSYYNDFNQIFHSVSELTDRIAEHIDKFSPIFQMHDISIQELGNLNKMIVKFIDDNKDMIKSINLMTSSDLKNMILSELLGEVEKKITTSNEISVVNNIYKRYEIKKEIIDNKLVEIEFF